MHKKNVVHMRKMVGDFRCLSTERDGHLPFTPFASTLSNINQIYQEDNQ